MENFFFFNIGTSDFLLFRLYILFIITAFHFQLPELRHHHIANCFQYDHQLIFLALSCTDVTIISLCRLNILGDSTQFLQCVEKVPINNQFLWMHFVVSIGSLLFSYYIKLHCNFQMCRKNGSKSTSSTPVQADRLVIHQSGELLYRLLIVDMCVFPFEKKKRRRIISSKGPDSRN